jgi:hypothetical protein
MADLTEFFLNVRNRAVALDHVLESGLLTSAQLEDDAQYFTQSLHYFLTVSNQFPSEVTASVVGDLERILKLLEDESHGPGPTGSVVAPPVSRSDGPGRPRFNVPDDYLQRLAQALTHCSSFSLFVWCTALHYTVIRDISYLLNHY